MELSLNDKKIGYSIIKYLRSLPNNAGNDDLTSSIHCLTKYFGIENADDQKYNYLDIPVPLRELVQNEIDKQCDPVEHEEQFKTFLKIVQDKGYFKDCLVGSPEYIQKYNKLIEKYKNDKQKSASSSGSTSNNNTNNEERANHLKELGNKELNASNYEKAIELYSEAINLCPNNKFTHLYYSNRAAAYIYKNQYEFAINDCQRCIELDPSFIKGYKRLSTCYVKMNKTNEAIDILEKAKKLAPDDKEIAENLNQLKSSSTPKFPTPPSSGPPGAGLGGLGDLFNNPNIMAAASKMMSDPNFMNMAQSMMNNPSFQQAMGGMGGMGGFPSPPGDNHNPSQSNTQTTPSGAPDTSILMELMKPESMAKMQADPRFQGLLQDPEVGPMLSNVIGNPMSAIQYLNNPTFKAKIPELVAIAKDVLGK